MHNRLTDHKNLDLLKLNTSIWEGRSNGMIIWQPRISCWYHDRKFSGVDLPEPYTGMDLRELFDALGCSYRAYDYTACIEAVDDPRIKRYSDKLSDLVTEYIIETPVGKVSRIVKANTSNYGSYHQKWWITCEEDINVFIWISEHMDYIWNEDIYWKIYKNWGRKGAPSAWLPRVNIQDLFINTMGIEGGMYALYDHRETIEKYFNALSEEQERFINVLNTQNLVRIINFGDNIHSALTPPDLFKKYILPEYQKRNEHLHKSGKLTSAHWDGNCRQLLQFAHETGLDGLEALTPKPQGDVTLEEIKKGLGDDMILIDGIAAILFDNIYPEEQLIEQVNRIIELFAPRLILGISDEMPSTGNIDRIKLVGSIVDEYNHFVHKP